MYLYFNAKRYFCFTKCFYLNFSLGLDKYLRDALGNKGLMLFEKWIKDKPNDEHMTDRECKLAYIIIRLLQNAK